MIVVDTNVLIYCSFQSSEPGLAVKARALAKAEARWALPGLWRHEFLNALCSYMRAGSLDSDQAWQLFAEALALYVHQESPVDMGRALELSGEYGISGYDAQFVALAEASNTVLVTEDQRLRRAVGDRAMSIDQYLKR
jgi:predicted nucleic acid-binding protein